MPLAWQAGVTFAKGGGFHTQEAYGEFTLRLNFAANSPELITQGINRLSAAIRKCGAEN